MAKLPIYMTYNKKDNVIIVKWWWIAFQIIKIKLKNIDGRNTKRRNSSSIG